MHTAVYLPFVLTAVVVALSRVAARRLTPRAAAWSTSLAVSVVAVCTVGALGLLVFPLLARLPLVARFGRWRPAAVAMHTPVPAWLSMAAVAALVALAWRVLAELRSLRDQLGDVVRAHAALADHGPRDVVVVADDIPRAHAVCRTITRPGRVIVTTALLDLLDDEERAAVVAHERSHLRHAHGVFLAICEIAVSLNPMLGPTRRDVRFALERWADEDAALATSRTVTASALAKAALATLQVANVRASGFAATHLHAHAVTDRVAALLEDDRPRRARLAWALLCTSVLAATALWWASQDTERFFEAVRRM